MFAIVFWAISASLLASRAHGAAVNKDLPSHVRALDAERADDPRMAGENWVMLQHWKVDESDVFDNNGWSDYKDGFGTPDEGATDYWMGLERMHQMTSSGRWRLLIKLRKNDYPTYNWIMYDDFKVGASELDYPLSIGSVVATRGVFDVDDDYLKYSNGAPFSTRDRDNDDLSGECSENQGHGGWWFRSCHLLCVNCKRYMVNRISDTHFYETYMGMLQIA